ncbi:MAG TPA: Lsr2 family protein [Nocardioides sp.]|uniref:histone-like nucleoid-structuring protein Lsr2 n=1 Tax=Nocardioides sp. TaxID=35761 RepID=UPI002E341533|nr:Lsr2 family protein [Nocardioides sp.]HEX5087944.1 Lsr2 family protein [Nocardioides sp.]
MAKRVKIIMTDDIDGGEATQTVRFGLDGREMEIDLTDENAIKLRKALLPYISAGRRVRSATSSRPPTWRPAAEGEAARRTTR